MAHLAVDFACAFLLLGVLAETSPLSILLYNFCAFALQMPLGLIAGRYGRPLPMAAAGCLLTAAAYPFYPLPAVAVLLAGMGNALFHVGAGVAVFRLEERHCGLLGLFVSPGALGLYLGGLLSAGEAPIWLAPLLLLPIALLFLRAGRPLPGNALPPTPAASTLSKDGIPTALCLFAVVLLRSLLSLGLPLPWKAAAPGGLAFTCATVFGKALGGLCAARFGIRRAALWPLALALPLIWGCGLPLPGMLAVLLLNMSMPITLWMMAQLLAGAKGFAFGLLSFALFLGFLPGYLYPFSLPPALAAAGAALSLLLLWAALRKMP